MNFPSLNVFQVFSLMRVGCGLSILINQIFVQFPNFQVLYGNSGMVNPNIFQFFSWSPLFIIWENDILKVIFFGIGILLTCMFVAGLFARWIHIPLFAIILSFQLANPMAIHEPQQITMLLCLLLWFVPYEKFFKLKASPGFETYETLESKVAFRILFCFQLFLGYYYLIAGLKKIPDPLWLSGEALLVFLNSAYLGIENGFSALVKIPWISKLGTWAALLFELSFLPLLFTRWRVYLIPAGLLFHIANIFLLDVGFFWTAMLMWYPVLMIKTDAKKPLAL